jgi:hypothetical protein
MEMSIENIETLSITESIIGKIAKLSIMESIIENIENIFQ